MISNHLLRFATLALFLLASSATIQARITTPREQFGFNPGDDYHLANYRQMVDYWIKLARESSRIKVVPIGKTEEGRTMVMAVITSSSNQRRLERYQQTSRRLALGEGLADKDAKKLAADGKAVVWISGGLHASETLGAQQLTETVYQLVNGEDAETKRILNDVIVLAVLANPDGLDLVADWYMAEPDPTKRSRLGLPRLYQKYIGHDNNRDFYAITQQETKNMSRVLFHEWFPQIVYDHHQSGPPGTVMFAPPFRDPFNYNLDPRVINGVDMLGAAMMNRFLAEDKPGVTTRSGTRYSTWFNGGLRTTTYYHNMIGLLTETIGSPNPMQIPYTPRLQLPRADLLSPIEPQTWHFRQSVDYSVTASKAVLDFASRHRADLLYNIYRMGHDAIRRGSQDSWTASPHRVVAAEKVASAPKKTASASKKSARKTTSVSKTGASTNEFAKQFRSPATRDPRGYILPSDQPDFLTATKFVNTLMESGIRVQRATREFTVAGKSYPAGSYVIQCAQPFRAHVLDMFEPQNHPDDIPYPGGPPTAPYDLTGWTLAFQMGVDFDRVLEGFTGPFEEVKAPLPPLPGRLENEKDAAGFFLSTRVNDAFIAVNRLLAAGAPVFRLKESYAADGVSHPAGTFFIPRQAATLPLLQKISHDLGVTFTGTATAPGGAAGPVQPVRLGLWDRYGGSMPSGWTRWLLERFEFPFQVVFPPQLDAGGLREKFDVLIFVDGAIPAPTNAAARTARAPDAAGDAPPAERPEETAGAAGEQNLPAEYRGRRGSVTASNTVPRLREFLEAGGTILAIGSSTSLATHLGLPVGSHLKETRLDGKEQPLPREKFYIPGSVMQTRVDITHPLAFGLAEKVDVMFDKSPAFRLEPEEGTNGVQRVAWFEGRKTLRSGWALGQEYLDGGVAVAEAPVGEGRLVLFGPEIAFRAQPHGTFKFLFNGILRAGTADQ